MTDTICNIGSRILRKEDPRLLRGEGCYIADLRLDGALHLAMVRSQHAHAKLLGVDVSAARQVDGVVTIITADDLGAVCKPLPQGRPHPTLRSCMALPLAQDKVRYVGEAIAAVVAESRYAAEDAAELVHIEYEPLPAVVDVEHALRPDAPLVHEELGDNIAAFVPAAYGDVDKALAEADIVFHDRLRIHRSGGQSIETRGSAAVYDASGPQLTLWSATQQPHFLRSGVAYMLDLSEEEVRVVAPDVGGGFGPKGSGYIEDVVLAFLARHLGRPVIWIEDRREALMCNHQEHEQVHDVEVGITRHGKLLALRDRIVFDTGAYVPKGLVVPVLSVTNVPGPYRLPAYAGEITVAYSNRVPVGPVRGAGRPQSTAVMETIMNRIAREVGRDPVEVRRDNILQPEEFPRDLGMNNENSDPIRYDSGNLPGLLEKIEAEIGYLQFREEQSRLRRQGVYRGLGVSLCVEATGQGPYEGARICLDDAGKATMYTGAASQGQGSHTTLAQVCAAELGMSIDDVTVIAGDTSMISKGAGAYASRIATVAATAAKMSCDRLIDRLTDLAADHLEARRQDIEFARGRFQVHGSPQRGVNMPDLLRAHGGIEETAYYEPTDEAYASGAQAAVVEVDPVIGDVRLLRYAAIHDCGVMINPTIVEGQVQGGIAHGIAETLYERMVYDDQGQYLSGSLMDFVMPSACEVPSVSISHQETPSPLSPLGVKGAGEGGAIGACGAILGAIEDALTPLGIRVRSSPVICEALANAIRRAAAEARQVIV